MLLIENFPSVLVALPKSVTRSMTLAPISGWWVSASITSPVMLPVLDANKNVECIAKIKVMIIFIITKGESRTIYKIDSKKKHLINQVFSLYFITAFPPSILPLR